MEQLIKDLEKTWESFKEHDDHARREQMIVCLDSIISTCELIKYKCIDTLSELR